MGFVLLCPPTAKVVSLAADGALPPPFFSVCPAPGKDPKAPAPPSSWGEPVERSSFSDGWTTYYERRLSEHGSEWEHASLLARCPCR